MVLNTIYTVNQTGPNKVITYTCTYIHGYKLQWNLSNTDTIGTKIFVLISEVSLFQGENNMKLGLSQES